MGLLNTTFKIRPKTKEEEREKACWEVMKEKETQECGGESRDSKCRNCD